MRRSFRVATAFTGAAAAVAGFAPAAGAATAAPDAAGAGNCTTAKTQDLVLYYAASEHHATPACVSGFGYVPIGNRDAHFKSYCGGRYSGYFWINGSPRHFTAGIIYHNLYGAEISQVSLSPVSNKAFVGYCKG
jgi:hypothetical protein